MRSDSNDRRRRYRIGFPFAWNGILVVLKTERNFQIHVICAIVVIIAGFMLGLSKLEWAIIMLVIGFVLVAEMINTAFEITIDYIKPEIHPSAKMLKDIAAGAVLMSAIIAVIIGLIIFLPKLYNVFS